ncbi:hypothetical protein PVL29_013848 [Vitis rotundifolia]|uniref:Uncharacterized protein n=1 Tax=Vitis rotundifolia TaxID=103349 RepID=A0AA39DL03_VITRO|nr:hypothetical protein PVL29_013848 [Vitis rotundifolia]
MGGYVSQWSKNAKGLRGSNRDNECCRRRPLPQLRNRFSSSKLASKRENGWGGRLLGPTEESFIGLTLFEPLNKAQPIRAQSGTFFYGLQAGPVASQAHETVVLSPSSRQQAVSFAKAIPLLTSSHGPIEGRASIVDLFGEDGRAFEIKAQSLPILSPPSDDVVGYDLKGLSRLGQSLKGKKSSVEKDRSQREEDVAALKGKAPEGQSRGSSQKEELVVSKRMWTTLFPPSSDHRQGLRSRSKPIFPAKPPSVNEARPLEEDFGTGSQSGREGTTISLFRRHLRNRGSGEGTSSSSGVVALRNQRFEEDKEGSMGRVGSDLRGFIVTGSLSSPEIRGKGLIFEGICEFPRMENSEVCMSSHSQPPESSSTPHCGLFLPMENRLSLLWKIEFFLKFCLIKTLLAIFFKIMLAFLSVMRW